MHSRRLTYAFMCHKTGFVRPKPSPELINIYCGLDPKNKLLSGKRTWKCPLQKSGHFVVTSFGQAFPALVDQIQVGSFTEYTSSPPSTAYMRQWIESALVQIMACRLFGAKLLSKPMLFLSIGPLGTNFNGILIKIQNFSLTKLHLKIPSAKWRPFCSGGDEIQFLLLPQARLR